MIKAVCLSCPQRKLSGTIILEPSKSISNRALIIRALCKDPFEINSLSASDDTKVLISMLSSDKSVLYSGHAGTSYRFMVALACVRNREVTIDASEQLRRRPIGPLVKALQSLGAEIQYLNIEGFPPLKIMPSNSFGKVVNEVTMRSGVSSQYITALLLIAPYLPNGLTIHLTDEPVSASYIAMTLSMMEYFGVGHQWKNNTIRIEQGSYKARDFTVESDWSAASYYYSLAALAEQAEIIIEGLSKDSIQGDAAVKDIYSTLGVETSFIDRGVLIKKTGMKERIKEFVYDFTLCPDLAQTVMVTLSGLGIKGKLSGLRTLRIKETDRILAMQTELARVKSVMDVKEEGTDIICTLTGKASWKDRGKFNTYDDHRMAMAFAPLACLNPIYIKEPDVVTKSYPGFWRDIEAIGVKVERLKIK